MVSGGLYPFAPHYLNRAGLRLHYLDEGAGPPVVCVHGNPTWSFFYRDVVTALKGSHRVVAPDHIGCGLSDKPDWYDYRLDSRIDDLEALIDHVLPDQKVSLVVHDWGGMIGLGWATRHPERVERLVVLNTAAFHQLPGKKIPWQLWIVRDTFLGPLLVRGLNGFVRGLVTSCSVRPLPADVKAGYLAPYDSWKNRFAVLRFVQDIPLKPGDPSYATVSEIEAGLSKLTHVPMLICWGEKDFVFDMDFLAEWRRRFPWAEVHSFPDAAHLLLEDAGDRIIPLIVEHLGRAVSDNIAAALTRMAHEQPDTVAMIQTFGIANGTPRERRWTYRELDAESDRLARGLMKMGLTRGTRTVLMVPPTPEFFALTFGLFKLGAVIVLIDPGMGVRNLGVCLGEAAPEAFIGVSKAHVGRILFGWARSTIRHRVTIGWRLWSGWSLERVRREGDGGPVLADARPDDMAAILFTSGSTGVAKGVVYTHAIFSAQVRALQELYGIEPGEIDLPTFPLFGLFGPALGVTTVLPEMDATRPALVDPRAIFNAAERYGVTNLFGSPALLRRVAFSKEAETRGLPSLRRVLSAGAPVPAVVLRQTERLLSEGVPIYTPYGATEALPVSNITHREVLDETAGLTTEGRGVCVGRPVPEMEVRIIRVSDEVIPRWSEELLAAPGEIGEIVVRGPVVTRSYFNRPHHTALHKIADWHRMGDVGYLDDEGRIWFCGRKAHRVVTRHGTLYTIPCEGVFNAHPAVLRTALVGVPAVGAVREPVVCIELDPEAGRVDRELVVRQLREMATQHEHTRRIERFLFHSGFPVDIRHNAKIFREKLAVWATRRVSVAGGA